jgi:hypothetical protein
MDNKVRVIEVGDEVIDAYDAACKQATTSQGLDPVVARLEAERLVVDVEQTGGFTMVATVKVPAGTVGITADSDDDRPYLVAFYPGQDWDQGEQEREWKAGLDLDAMAALVVSYLGE